ncbi:MULTISPECIES: YihY/virulence factor BrkB family protein [unclassified Microbacterium]|uniref:YihY/virulence factor BrkB family protein n=1 Tax=unclassified Microbacterium TaxID=2609290 RepID=UPI001DF42771|nr:MULTISPECIES: YihY/virulence factor BrkB family protein [unclassified Microbacterium]CAH0209804.1 Inner membrane protein YhjD [Microbacterium sp. Bi121]HWK78511.1 YihY/virulence factor BrkB family protein [Microbacterium sp.]
MPLRERLEGPLERAAELKDRTLAAFPVRVWRGFLRGNGFLLSAGMSYYVLFSLFAVIYVSFAGVGLWMGASPRAIDMLIDLANSYLPGLIGDPGLFERADVVDIAQRSTGLLTITGAVAVGFAAWTAISAVTFTRRAIRDIFGLPFDTRSYWLLKLRDLFAGILFGLALLLGAALSVLSIWALESIFELFGWPEDSWVLSGAGRALWMASAFVVDAGALAALVRFLVGADLRWRFIWPASLLGGGAMVVLQLAAGLLLTRVPTNPLLASFAVIIGLLLWCRLLASVVLVAASWIAVTAADHDHPLELEDEQAARLAEQEALVLAARVQLRRARDAYDEAPWYRRWFASRGVRRAEDTLAIAIEGAEAEDVTGPR